MNDANRTVNVPIITHLVCAWIFAALWLMCTLSAAALAMYLPALAGRAIDLLIRAGKVDFQALNAILARLALSAILAALCPALASIFGRRAAGRIAANLHTHVLSDVQMTEYVRLFKVAITLLGALGFMLYRSAGTAVVIFLLTPASLPVSARISRYIHDSLQNQTNLQDEQNALVGEAVGGAAAVQIFSQGHSFQARFDAINAQLEDITPRASFLSSLPNLCIRSFDTLVYTCALTLGTLSAVTGGLTAGQLVCFLIYTHMYVKAFHGIADSLAKFPNAHAANFCHFLPFRY